LYSIAGSSAPLGVHDPFRMMVTCIPRAELWADQLNQARHVGRDEGRQGATATFPAPICRATANAGGPSLTFRLAKHPAATPCGASRLDAPEEYSITIECGCDVHIG